MEIKLLLAVLTSMTLSFPITKLIIWICKYQTDMEYRKRNSRLKSDDWSDF